jgi:hypothetical protein
MDFEKAQKLKKSLIPQEGFNVVGIDTFALPDEALYFIEHYDNAEDAIAKVREKEKEGIKAFVYDSNTM